MPRLARAVVPGLPHHVTQRGNRRMQTFFNTADYLAYLAHMREQCNRFGVEIWAWCLMPNHSHLIAVPEEEDSLRRALGEAHRRYSAEVNRREGWRGHLWQYRFSSFPMDERYTLAAARYIELNPVRARMVVRPEEYPWSSARAHLAGRDDALGRSAPLLQRVPDWAQFLGVVTGEDDEFRKHQRSGRPLGSEKFIDRLELQLGRPLRAGKPGPKSAVEIEAMDSGVAVGTAA